jgi:adenine C2-methylase RlmN of 23S rRNA A2503 and tRNA A37
VLFAELDSGTKISNIVLMGIGEPLDNFDNVMRFLKLVNHPSVWDRNEAHFTFHLRINRKS